MQTAAAQLASAERGTPSGFERKILAVLRNVNTADACASACNMVPPLLT